MKSAARMILILVPVLLVALAGCEIVIFPPGPGGAFDEEFSFTTAFDDAGSIQVEWRNGHVTALVDPDATEITVSGTKTVAADSDNLAEMAMEDFEIRLFVEAVTPSRLILQFDAPEFVAGTVFSADVEVVLPGGLELAVEHVNGDVTVTGNTQSTEIILANGDATVTNNNGTCDIDVNNGAVVVTGQQGDTIVDLNNGNVEVSSDSGNVDIRVSAGNIAVQASPAADGELIARTEVGSVEIAVDADTPAFVELRGTIGSVTIFPEDFTVVTALTTSPTGITATLNGGGGQITGETDIGSVELGAR